MSIGAPRVRSARSLGASAFGDGGVASAAVATLGLIHGACHGAWCWELLVPQLAERGHETIAVDLPCEEVTAGFDRYVEVTERAFAHAPEDLVLVAHSLGAHTAVRLAMRRPVGRIVFVSGIIPPREGERSDDEPELEAPGAFDHLEQDAEGRFSFPDPEDAISAFYQDVPRELAEWAVERLRPQSTTPHRALGEVLAWPEVALTSIVCSDDRVASAAWGRWAARERLLGAPVFELPGSHSPFLSRPGALAELLDRIVG
jgi:pimeloyl-ACP methyl ester carboxylesterase